MTQNSEKETDFLRNLKTTMSRRTFLRDGASLGATAFVIGSANFSTATTRTYNRNSFAFSAVPASTKSEQHRRSFFYLLKKSQDHPTSLSY